METVYNQTFQYLRTPDPDIDLNTKLKVDSETLSLISCVSHEYFANLLLTNDSSLTVQITVYKFKLDLIIQH